MTHLCCNLCLIVAPPSWKCQPCDDLEPIFDDLADVVSLNSEFLLARMDAIANEVEQIKVINYPTLMLVSSTKSCRMNVCTVQDKKTT